VMMRNTFLPRPQAEGPSPDKAMEVTLHMLKIIKEAMVAHRFQGRG